MFDKRGEPLWLEEEGGGDIVEELGDSV